MKTLWNGLFGNEDENSGVEMTDFSEDTNNTQHANRYFFEYRFIPDLVAEVKKEKLPVEVLVSVDGWKPFLAENVDGFSFDWDQFRCDYCTVGENDLLVVYKFPNPIQVPEAIYGAVLVNMNTKDARYYTLEYSFDGDWVLGSMDTERHANYGVLENPTFENFIAWVVKNMSNEGKGITLRELSLEM